MLNDFWHNYNLHCQHEHVFLYTRTQTQVLCAVFFWDCRELSTEGLSEGRLGISTGSCVSGVGWGVCSGMWMGVGGGWDGQDRLSSLPPVCYGWIGDYSSRCVIRSEQYSCGCRVRRRVTRERSESVCVCRSHALQESRFTGVKWIYGMCQVVFLSSFLHPRPLQLSFHDMARQEAPWNKCMHKLSVFNFYIHWKNTFLCLIQSTQTCTYVYERTLLGLPVHAWHWALINEEDKSS